MKEIQVVFTGLSVWEKAIQKIEQVGSIRDRNRKWDRPSRIARCKADILRDILNIIDIPAKHGEFWGHRMAANLNGLHPRIRSILTMVMHLPSRSKAFLNAV